MDKPRASPKTAMASALLSLYSTLNPYLSSSKLLHQHTTSLSNPSLPYQSRTRGRCRQVSAVGGDLLGDLGARDPFPAELESNFGEKVVGYGDTEHKILIPNLSAISLAQRSCEPISLSQSPISTEDAEKLLKKVFRLFLLLDVLFWFFYGFHSLLEYPFHF